MKAESLKCPNCAAPLPGFAPGTSQLDCDYCNTAIQIRDDGTAAKRVGLLEAPRPTAESTREPTEFEKAIAAYNAHVLSPAYTGGEFAAKARTTGKSLTLLSALIVFAATPLRLWVLVVPALLTATIALLGWMFFSSLCEFLIKPRPNWFARRRELLQRLETLAASEAVAFAWPTDVPREESVELELERKKRSRARRNSVLILATPFVFIGVLYGVIVVMRPKPLTVDESVIAATQARVAKNNFAVCDAIEDPCLANVCRNHKVNQDDVVQNPYDESPTLARYPNCGNRERYPKVKDLAEARLAHETKLVGQLFVPRRSGRCEEAFVSLEGAQRTDKASAALAFMSEDFESLCQAVLDRESAPCTSMHDDKLKAVCNAATR